MASKNLTVSALARAAGLSRSTLLYYDRLGLLRPSARSAANYRLYSDRDARRLERICLHRHMGIPLREIGRLLRDSGGGTAAAILRRRMVTLDREIEGLRRQQLLITRILNDRKLQKESPMVNKERWVEIMRAAGLSEKDMHNWHIQFEKMEPEAHQEFLESLGIPPVDIRKIRQWSRSAGAE